MRGVMFMRSASYSTQLVADQLPYAVSKKHIFDGTQVIREHQPTKLSTINKTLRGDVETIVLKALEKEPSRRYQSATDFAHDISSYLSGEAISARPPSAVYRIGLYARRKQGEIECGRLGGPHRGDRLSYGF